MGEGYGDLVNVCQSTQARDCGFGDIWKTEVGMKEAGE